MHRLIISTLAVAALSLAACSGDGQPSAESADTGSTAAPPAPSAPTVAGRWTLTDINGQPPLASAEAWLELDLEAGQISGTAGCNRFSAGFDGEPAALTIGPVAATKKMCPEDVMAQEAAMLAVLTAVTSATVDAAGALKLTGTAGNLSARAQ